MGTTHISTFVTDGSYWTSNVVSNIAPFYDIISKHCVREAYQISKPTSYIFTILVMPQNKKKLFCGGGGHYGIFVYKAVMKDHHP
jgi:hypothetical protein